MAKEHAIIRKLQAVEGLGSVSVICSDKTGTLTQNKMTVEDYYIDGKRIAAAAVDVSDPAQSCLLYDSILCNDSTNENGMEIGDPTETALINLGKRYGVEAAEVRRLSPRKGEIPFDSDRKMMSTLHQIDGKNRMIVKGAIDCLMARTEWIWTSAGVRELTEKDKEIIRQQNQDFSMEGLRVLAFAYRDIPDKHLLTAEDENHLVFLGLIAMMDPPREESKAAVAECIKAGIRPVMITGDHKITAAAIAKRIGILHDLSEACEGADIEKMSDDQLKEFVPHISVYARVSPEHKIRIVRAWQERGMIVAMTGDGVNDVLALKEADCSIAMSTGSDATKNVSQLVLLDSNFSSMPEIVKEGRRTINNIERSASLFLVKTVYASILALLFIFIKMPYPFIPIQLTLASVSTIGIPSFILSFEPNNERVTGKFLPNVLKKAVPPAITIVINILIIIIISSILKLTYTQTSTLSVLMTGYTSFILLFKVCQPFNMMRKCLFGSMFLLFVFGIVKLKTIFSFSSFTLPMIFTTILCIITSHYFYNLIEHVLKKSLENAKKMQEEKRKTLLKQI